MRKTYEITFTIQQKLTYRVDVEDGPLSQQPAYAALVAARKAKKDNHQPLKQTKEREVGYDLKELP